MILMTMVAQWKKTKNIEKVFFFERNSESDKTYKLTTKRAFFSKESIVYPFVQMKHITNGRCKPEKSLEFKNYKRR